MNGTGGIGLFGLMFLLLFGLKLTGLIAWSWWWVTAPLWGPLFLALFAVFVAMLLSGRK